MAEPTPELNKALAAFQTKLPRIAKSKSVDTGKYGFSYAELDAVVQAIEPELGDNGLSHSAAATVRDDGHQTLIVSLRHASGEQIDSEFLVPDKLKPQDWGSWISYFRRYGTCMLTGVAPGGEDDDGAAVKDAGAPKRTRTKIPGPEHERLRADAARGRVDGAERSRKATEDAWTDQPAGVLPPSSQDPEDRPGTIDGKQRTKIMRVLGQRPRDDRLNRLSEITGRPVESANDLSWVEAEKVLKELEAAAPEVPSDV